MDKELSRPGHLINFFKKEYEVKAIYWPIHIPSALIVGFAFFKEFHFWSQYVLGLLSIIGIAIIFVIGGEIKNISQSLQDEILDFFESKGKGKGKGTVREIPFWLV